MTQKYVIVTGASSGIGGAIALELGKSGHFIALIGRNQARLNEIKAKVDAVGGGQSDFHGQFKHF